MSDSSVKIGGSLGFFELLTVALVVLKLLDKIDCSWWIVFAPIWIPISVVGLISVLWVLCVVILEWRN